MAHAEGIPNKINGAAAAVAEPRTLDDLLSLSATQLLELYEQGRTPQLGVLAGATRGALLSIPALSSLPIVGAALQRIVGRIASLAWKGKTFAPPGEHHHTSGANRMLGRELFAFEASLEKSALDHRDTLVLRYRDWPVQAVVDELREVARGVWLGPAYVRGPNGPVVVLWWGCTKE